MKLQTTIPLEKVPNPIDYQSRLLLMGSCFVENMGEKLNYFKFQQLQNPFGILFHPLAIENLVQRSLEEWCYKETEVFESDGIWHCFDAHSDVSAQSQEILLQNLNQKLHETRLGLRNATHIVITLGTAWVYRHKTLDKIVANCHKIPQKEFTKELLSIETIAASLENMVKIITEINPEVQFVFTISPVRHLKDGFVENQQSKAHLIAAVQSLMSPRAKSRGLHYFPAYEIMMDELRDYRFYGKDMVHPNGIAVDYIWEKFSKVFISEASLETMLEVNRIRQGMAHRPFNPDSEKHHLFLKNLENRIKELQKKLPFIDFI